MNRLIIYLFSAIFIASCARYPSDVEHALKLAGNNRAELEKVLKHYSKHTEDSLKLLSAYFLIANMPYHHTFTGQQIDTYRSLLLSEDEALSVRAMDSLWNSVKKSGPTPQRISHASIVDAEYLQNEIDEAFKAWERAAWKDSISFNLFLEYIAPYSLYDEPLYPHRKMLYEKYAPLIEGVNNPKQAFDKVYSHIIKNFAWGGFECPFLMDPEITDRSMIGMCDDRSMYIVSVARALCIPAAVDHITSYANFSDATHSWVTYVGDGTKVFTIGYQMYFTTVKYDSISYNNGLIDGMFFNTDYLFDDKNINFNIDTLKTFAKIWRKTFKLHVKKEIDYNNTFIARHFSILSKDVSHLYQITNNDLLISSDHPVRNTVYLCTFLCGRGWVPVDAARPQNNHIKFENIAKNIAYLPMYINKGELTPVSNPIILYADQTKKILDPDYSQTETVVLNRKFMIRKTWLPRWSKAIGCRFELSDTKDFKGTKTELLYEIPELPIGIQHIDVQPSKAYRYVRFLKPAIEEFEKSDSSKLDVGIAEMSFFTTNENGESQEIKGTIFGKTVKDNNIHKAYDKDYLTKADLKAGEWIAVDFEKQLQISSLHYCMWNDANFIETGHLYELLYYDMGWKSLGKQVAEKNYLIYNNVPENAILWLKDHTKGKEERIFTYENDRQKWW